MKYHSVGLAMIVLGCLVGSSFGATLLEDDFSGDLSKWNIEGSASIISTDGNPAPCARTVPISWLVSKQTFEYAGRSLTISADMRDTDGGWQRATDLDLFSSSNPWGSIAVIGVHGSNAGGYTNTVSCAITYDAQGHVESSGYIALGSIPGLTDLNGDNWHNGRISIRSSGLVDFYLDDIAVWTSTHTVADFGASPIHMGGWATSYDNVLVTPEPAALALFALGGFAALRRRRVYQQEG